MSNDFPTHDELMADTEDDIINKEQRNMVKEMLDADDAGFSEWEMEFLDSVWKWSGHYTEKQQARIEKIYKAKM